MAEKYFASLSTRILRYTLSFKKCVLAIIVNLLFKNYILA